MPDHYKFTLLEVCQDLHSGAKGTLEAPPEYFKEMYEWLVYRLGVWTHTDESTYDELLRGLCEQVVREFSIVFPEVL